MARAPFDGEVAPTLSLRMSPSAIAAEIGIPRATVYRIKEDPAKAVALLQTWGIA